MAVSVLEALASTASGTAVHNDSCFRKTALHVQTACTYVMYMYEAQSYTLLYFAV
jgi:hypothetical protein